MNKISESENSKGKNKTALFGTIVLLAVLVVGGVIFFTKSQSKNTPITLEEVSKHNSNSDCWTTINGKVYNVTNFISKHKGGDKILNACGKDATDLFTGKSPFGRVHSEVAVKLLSKMQIGILQN
jgi:cytochrome b involved in lipid metabolism